MPQEDDHTWYGINVSIEMIRHHGQKLLGKEFMSTSRSQTQFIMKGSNSRQEFGGRS